MADKQDFYRRAVSAESEARFWRDKAGDAEHRIEALEADNRELAMQLLATDGQAQEALERAVNAEAERDWWQERAEGQIERAIQTALEMAGEEAWNWGGQQAENAIRAIRVEDVLKKMENRE